MVSAVTKFKQDVECVSKEISSLGNISSGIPELTSSLLVVSPSLEGCEVVWHMFILSLLQELLA